MQIRELSIAGALEISPVQHADDRGVFLEWYRFDRLAEVVGHPLDLRQGNTSVSRRGVLRGIHFADVPPSQAKYVTVPSGAVIDYVIDIREGSPTFGRWEAVRLDDVDRRAVYIPEGLGHAFVAVSDSATLSYLVSDVYRPDREHAIHPLDPEVALELPFPLEEILISPRDLEAPSLREALTAGALPSYAECASYARELDARFAEVC